MLRALGPEDAPSSDAYPVPWRVDRRRPGHPRLVNAGALPAESVRVFVVGAGASQVQRWGRLRPGEDADVCLCGVDLAATMVSVAWFHPETGLEYVWAFVM